MKLNQILSTSVKARGALDDLAVNRPPLLVLNGRMRSTYFARACAGAREQRLEEGNGFIFGIFRGKAEDDVVVGSVDFNDVKTGKNISNALKEKAVGEGQALSIIFSGTVQPKNDIVLVGSILGHEIIAKTELVIRRHVVLAYEARPLDVALNRK